MSYDFPSIALISSLKRVCFSLEISERLLIKYSLHILMFSSEALCIDSSMTRCVSFKMKASSSTISTWKIKALLAGQGNAVKVKHLGSVLPEVQGGVLLQDELGSCHDQG